MSVRENIARAIVEGLRESDPGAYIEEDELIGGCLRGKIDGEFILPIDRILDAMRESAEAMKLAGAKAAVDQVMLKGDAWARGLVSDECKEDWLNAAGASFTAMIDAAKEG